MKEVFHVSEYSPHKYPGRTVAGFWLPWVHEGAWLHSIVQIWNFMTLLPNVYRHGIITYAFGDVSLNKHPWAVVMLNERVRTLWCLYMYRIMQYKKQLVGGGHL